MLRQSPRLLGLGSFRTLANWRWSRRKIFRIHRYLLFLMICFVIFNKQRLRNCMGFYIIILCSFSVYWIILNCRYWLRWHTNGRLRLFVSILSSVACSLLTLWASLLTYLYIENCKKILEKNLEEFVKIK